MSSSHPQFQSAAPVPLAGTSYASHGAASQTEVRKRVVQVPVTVMQEQVIEERVQVGRTPPARSSDVA